jgi:hypothetical protein
MQKLPTPHILLQAGPNTPAQQPSQWLFWESAPWCSGAGVCTGLQAPAEKSPAHSAIAIHRRLCYYCHFLCLNFAEQAIPQNDLTFLKQDKSLQ